MADYPRWVRPHGSWIMHPSNGRDYVPDFPGPKSMSSTQAFHQAHPEMNKLVDDAGGNWLVLAENPDEERKVRAPRNPPLPTEPLAGPLPEE